MSTMPIRVYFPSLLTCDKDDRPNEKIDATINFPFAIEISNLKKLSKLRPLVASTLRHLWRNSWNSITIHLEAAHGWVG